jgi:hypothetical protein
MAEKLLHGPDIVAIQEEMRGKRMAQGVAGRVLGDSRFPRCCLVKQRRSRRDAGLPREPSPTDAPYPRSELPARGAHSPPEGRHGRPLEARRCPAWKGVLCSWTAIPLVPLWPPRSVPSGASSVPCSSETRRGMRRTTDGRSTPTGRQSTQGRPDPGRPSS